MADDDGGDGGTAATGIGVLCGGSTNGKIFLPNKLWSVKQRTQHMLIAIQPVEWVKRSSRQVMVWRAVKARKQKQIQAI